MFQNSINIHTDLYQKCPNLQLAYIHCKVQIDTKNEKLWQNIEETATNIKNTVLTAPDIGKLPNIAESRAAYKRLGKEPSRYRHTINLVSLQSGYSIGGYNAEKIVGDVVFGIGKYAEPYEAIGRGSLNIEFLPVFRDEIGAFGSPTSDSVRTMIGKNTQALLMLIIDFGGKKEFLEATQKQAIELLKKYTNANDFESGVIF